MDKKDFSDLEDRIMFTVDNALKAIDFANLKKGINNKTDDALNQFKSKLNEYSLKYKNLNKKSKRDISSYLCKKPAGSTSSIVYIVFGLGGTLLHASSVFTFFMFKALFSSTVIPGSNVVFGVSLTFLIISIGLLARGIFLRKRVSRFKQYVKFLNNNYYFLIKDLAKFYKQKESFVIKDLNKMIDLGMFLEGHIDDENTYFMLTDEVYRDYLNFKKQAEEEALNKQKLDNEINSSKNSGVLSTIKAGRDYIEQIKAIRNDISSGEITIKLDKLISVSSQILSQVEKNPKKINEVNKFINHYLPVTIKLVDSYKDLNSQLVQGDNIKSAKIEIEKSIDLINNAFENLLDDLFEDVALDISTDISVLKTLFKQEGLAEEDFKK